MASADIERGKGRSGRTSGPVFELAEEFFEKRHMNESPPSESELEDEEADRIMIGEGEGEPEEDGDEEGSYFDRRAIRPARAWEMREGAAIDVFGDL